jgi:hypothetical protein
MTSNSKSVLLRMTPAQYAALKNASELTNQSMNVVANQAIDWYITRNSVQLGNAMASYGASILRSAASMTPPESIQDESLRGVVKAAVATPEGQAAIAALSQSIEPKKRTPKRSKEP